MEIEQPPRAIRWLGEQNCPEVFAWLGLDHGVDETDHSRIRGLGEDGGQDAHWGDWLVRGEDGVVTPVSDSVYQATGGVDA